MEGKLALFEDLERLVSWQASTKSSGKVQRYEDSDRAKSKQLMKYNCFLPTTLRDRLDDRAKHMMRNRPPASATGSRDRERISYNSIIRAAMPVVEEHLGLIDLGDILLESELENRLRECLFLDDRQTQVVMSAAKALNENRRKKCATLREFSGGEVLKMLLKFAFDRLEEVDHTKLSTERDLEEASRRRR